MRTTLSVLGSLLAMSMIQGCGSSAATPNDGGGSSACAITLTGGVTSVHGCAVTFAYDGTVPATDFSLSTTDVDSATEPNLYASIQTSGSPLPGTFTETDGRVLQGLLAVSADDTTDAWSADSATANTAVTGTFSLMITDLGSATPVGGSSFYTKTHGTLDALLIPVTVGQTTAAITAHAQF